MKQEKRFITYGGAVKFLNGKNFVLCNEALKVDENLLSDLSKEEVEYLRKNFKGILFAYSEALCLWVLCVDFFGTSWNNESLEISSTSTISDEAIKEAETRALKSFW